MIIHNFSKHLKFLLSKNFNKFFAALEIICYNNPNIIREFAMNHLTIKPLLSFINSQTKGYVTEGDVKQLEDKIKNQLAKKITQGHAVNIDQEYLKIIAQLKETIGCTKKMSNERVIEHIDQILKESHFNYKKNKHPVKHRSNLFFTAKDNGEKLSNYDLAFYNELSSKNHKGHHQHNKQKSIYYMRCEERGEQILFGNMQIDDTDKEGWENQNIGNILLQKKNIYGMMVQQALKHALENNKKTILFQCGDANDLAQWGKVSLNPVKITKKNYKKFHEVYQAQIKNFTTEKIKLGDVLKTHEEHVNYIYITEVGDGYYKAYDSRGGYSLLQNLIDFNTAESWDDYGDDYLKRRKTIINYTDKILASMRKKDYRQALRLINEFVFQLTGVFPDSEKDDKKLALIKNIVKNSQADYIEWDCIGDMLQTWQYDEIILNQFPAIKKLNLNKARPDGMKDYIYYNSANFEKNNTYIKNLYIEPEIGKTYLVPPSDKYNINFEQPPVTQNNRYAKIHKWYESTLQKEFKKYNLKYEKIEITTVKKGSSRKAHAWKITDGIEEFKSRPLTVFAARHQLKMDCETMPRLHHALEKFGGTAAQLTIINKFLTDATIEKSIGSYEKATGEIKLANQSLAALAHEGLHLLNDKGMIPKKEYKAMIKAGKALAAQNKAEKDYIKQKDNSGNEVYPPGKARDEEYAAIFVENYYENATIARKNLMGVKLTVVEKVLDYVKEVRDIIQAKLGNDKALARSFLRLVEKNNFNPKNTGKTQKLKKDLNINTLSEQKEIC